VLATRGIVNRLGSSGVKVISIREPWTEVDGLLREGVAFVYRGLVLPELNQSGLVNVPGSAWLGQWPRVNVFGRLPGSKDGKLWKRSGYYARYASK
jgi:hypothetical protein